MPKARRPSFSLETQDKIIALLSQGYTRTSVYRPFGVTDEAWDHCLTMPAWRHRVLAAESAFVKVAQEKVLESASKTIEGARYFLEKRASEDFGNRQKLQLEADKPIRVTLKTYAVTTNVGGRPRKPPKVYHPC